VTARPLSHWLAVTGLAVIAILLSFRLAPGWPLVLAVPPALLALAGLNPAPRWGGWVAVLMIPCLSAAIADVLVSQAGRWSSGLVAVLSVAVFFFGLDAVRRSGTSLRS